MNQSGHGPSHELLVRELRSELVELTPLPAPEGEAIAGETVANREWHAVGP
jgi:hypothetical protein